MFNPQPKPEKQEKKKPKRMRSKSVRRAKQEVIYAKVRVLHLQLFPQCVVCGHAANQVHHACGRIGDRLIDRKHFKSVCEGCHVIIENNPEWAKKHGYSADRL